MGKPDKKIEGNVPYDAQQMLQRALEANKVGASDMENYYLCYFRTS